MPYVKSHYRKGHRVRAHYRRPPGVSGIGIGTIAVIIFILWVIGKMHGA